MMAEQTAIPPMAYLIAESANEINPWDHHEKTYGYFKDGYHRIIPGKTIGSKVHHPRRRSCIAPHKAMGRNYSYALANPVNLRQAQRCDLTA